MLYRVETLGTFGCPIAMLETDSKSLAFKYADERADEGFMSVVTDTETHEETIVLPYYDRNEE